MLPFDVDDLGRLEVRLSAPDEIRCISGRQAEEPDQPHEGAAIRFAKPMSPDLAGLWPCREQAMVKCPRLS